MSIYCVVYCFRYFTFSFFQPLAHSFVNAQFSINGKISQLFVQVWLIRLSWLVSVPNHFIICIFLSQVRLFNSACQSDSCSSPWSESVPLTNETSCSVSSHIDTIIKPLSNEQKAIRNGRCYSACVDQVSLPLHTVLHSYCYHNIITLFMLSFTACVWYFGLNSESLVTSSVLLFINYFVYRLMKYGHLFHPTNLIVLQLTRFYIRPIVYQ